MVEFHIGLYESPTPKHWSYSSLQPTHSRYYLTFWESQGSFHISLTLEREERGVCLESKINSCVLSFFPFPSPFPKTQLFTTICFLCLHPLPYGWIRLMSVWFPGGLVAHLGEEGVWLMPWVQWVRLRVGWTTGLSRIGTRFYVCRDLSFLLLVRALLGKCQVSNFHLLVSATALFLLFHFCKLT